VIVCIFLYWLMSQIPLPQPLQKIAIIVLVTIGVLVLIALLLSFAGMGGSQITSMRSDRPQCLWAALLCLASLACLALPSQARPASTCQASLA